MSMIKFERERKNSLPRIHLLCDNEVQGGVMLVGACSFVHASHCVFVVPQYRAVASQHAFHV